MELDRTLSSEVLNSFPYNMALLDASGVILQTNRAWEKFASQEDVPGTYSDVGKNYLKVCRTSDNKYDRRAARGLRQIIDGKQKEFTMEYPCQTSNQKRWFILRITPFEFFDSVYYLVIHIDITDRKHSEQKSNQLAEVVHNIPIGLITFTRADTGDSDFKILNVNPAAKSELNLGETVQGKPITDVLPEVKKSGLAGVMDQVLNSESAMEIDEYQSTSPRLQGRIWNLRLFPLPGEKGAIAFEEVTSQVKNRERLEHIATHDELTGLMNRVLFLNHLEEELNRTRRYGDSFCLMVLDIDHFKNINDRYGHIAGDRVLERLGDLLKKHVRSADLVGRYGGEEFVVLLPQTDRSEAKQIAERIRRTVANVEFEHEGNSFRITISIGISSFREGDREPEDLIARADNALYRAKNNGRNRVELAEPDGS